MLENSAVKAGTVIVVTLANHLAAANNDTAMTVVEGRFGGLLEAKREIIVRLHCDCLAGLTGGLAGDSLVERIAGVDGCG